MQNFDFHNPTRIVFGKGLIADLGTLVPADAKVLILVGGSSAEKTGTLAEVRQALGARQHATFSGIEPNPSYETSMQAVQQVKDGNFDFLLAVGGGSVIDAVKFIAAAALFEGNDAWSILEKHGRNITRALPFGTVLTLPATGSEMNSGGVITRRSIGAKLAFGSAHCFPVFSVLDPTKTYTLPVKQLANGVVDAFVHTVEQYLTYPANTPLQDRFAEGILQTLVDIGPRLLADTEPNYDDRASLVWAAIFFSVLRDSFANLGYPAWMAVTNEIVPIEGRGRFFGSRNFINSSIHSVWMPIPAEAICQCRRRNFWVKSC